MGKTLSYIVLLASSIFFNNSVNGQVLTLSSIPRMNQQIFYVKKSNPALELKIRDHIRNNQFRNWDMVELGNPDLSFEGDARDAFEDQGKLFLKEWRGLDKEKLVQLRAPSVYYNPDSKFNLDFKLDNVTAKHTWYNFRTDFKLNLSGAKIETKYSIPYNLNASAGVKWNFEDVEFFGGVSMPLSKTGSLSLTANSNGESSRLMLGLRFDW